MTQKKRVDKSERREEMIENGREKDVKKEKGRLADRPLLHMRFLSRAILMRRTCYMEWNKGVTAGEKEKKEGGERVASWREKEERNRAEY